MIFTLIQQSPLAIGQLYTQLMESTQGAGAHVTFTGSVRDFNAQGSIDGIELEHYPGMTDKALQLLAESSKQRFDCHAVFLVHRIGIIKNYQPIVWVGVASAHRQAAFDAARFCMDSLKQTIPLWKKEWRGKQATWVEAKDTDEQAFAQWEQGSKCTASKK